MSGRYGLKTVTRLRSGGRLRAAGLVTGMLACVAMVGVGCQSLTQGKATVDASEAPVYRASVSASSAEASLRSSSKASESRASVTKQAVHASCDELSTTSVNAVDALNAFVHDFNANAPGAKPKAKVATDTLNDSADRVAASLSPPLPGDLAGALTDWTDAARKMGAIVSTNFGMEEFNGAVDRLNDVKTTALRLCDAAY